MPQKQRWREEAEAKYRAEYLEANGKSWEISEGEVKHFRVFKLDGGSVYSGDMRRMNNTFYPHGNGYITYSNGDSYEGDFVDGDKHGHGYYKWDDGTYYDGQFKNNVIHGRGKKVYEDKNSKGFIYDGEWVDWKKHGQGTLTKNDRLVYKGKYKCGKRSVGTGYYKNGNTYYGEWKDGMRHGSGCWKRSDGSCIYKGDWKKDMFDGPGKLYLKDGRMIYDAVWKDDKMNGYGTRYFVSEKYAPDDEGNYKDIDEKTIKDFMNGDKELLGGKWHKYYKNGGKGFWVNNIPQMGEWFEKYWFEKY